MKRTLASPVASGRTTARRRIGQCDDREAAITSLLDAWTRALDGTGSADDLATWQRFAALAPLDPGVAYRLAESSGIPVDVLVASTYEPAWARVAALPAVASLIDRGVDLPGGASPCLLPSFVDLIDATERNVADDSRASLSRIIDDITSPDAGVRSQAAVDLVTMLDVSLRRRAVLAALGQGAIAPDYPPALPPSTWAPAAEALGAEHKMCGAQRAYYVFRTRVGPHPEGAADSLPQEGIYAFIMGPFGDENWPRTNSMVTRRASPAREYYHDSYHEVYERDAVRMFGYYPPLPRDVIEAFLTALAQAPPPSSYRTDNLAGVSQVRNALVPLYDLSDLPKRVAETFYKGAGNNGEDWWAAPIDDLAGVWITECELVTAARVFSGQVEARRHASLFPSRPPTLFDAVTDAVARGRFSVTTGATGMSMGGDYVPSDTIRRMLPRLWFQTCSADPDPVLGTLQGATALAEAANALGIPVDAATSLRPELLCATLAQRAIQEQARENYRDFVPPAMEEGAPLWPGLDGDDGGGDGIWNADAGNPFVFS
ncbi:hypothetical protein pmac_cds_359 [Pandoravirus macleodensis]|uniref:Uncharacterized protein n=1 Tax=Pandoravirus macleodensis TaxID=2107707 RepID=A0A2U7UF19_9VIRU|nr:hypothetical protein pmac_cds_359 [Pandoravirus macleodensis]AVK77047.1 hypothetical protein pmac_cds_359 [Pandoravirus macleodensis]